jgi:peptide deformylase
MAGGAAPARSVMEIQTSTIRIDPDPVLRAKAAPVAVPLSPRHRDILQSMLDFVRLTHDEQYCQDHNVRAAVGIAAPQIGESLALLAVSNPDEENGPLEFAMADPKIISNSVRRSYLEGGESCLSVVPDVQGIVPRYAKITVRTYELLRDQWLDIRLTGYPAVVVQHEIDHLNGILYYDHIDRRHPDIPPSDAIAI